MVIIQQPLAAVLDVPMRAHFFASLDQFDFFCTFQKPDIIIFSYIIMLMYRLLIIWLEFMYVVY